MSQKSAMERGQSSTTDPTITQEITRAHLAYLAERGLDEELVRRAKLASLPRHTVEEVLGYGAPSSGLGVPYWGAGEVSWRVRLDEPGEGRDGKKAARWRTPKAHVRPYLPPEGVVEKEVWHDASVPLLVSEGPIKALALAGAGWPGIGLGGVETGHDVEALAAGQVLLHAELLRRVKWAGRKVFVVFDAGRAVNPRVALGEARLSLALEAAGAEVYVTELPLYQGKDQGPDDYLVREGKEALSALLNKARLAHPKKRLEEELKTDKRAALREALADCEALPYRAQLHLRPESVLAQTALLGRGALSRRVLRDAAQDFASLLHSQRGNEAAELDHRVADFNKRFAVVVIGGKARILREKTEERGDSQGFDLLAEADFRLAYKHLSTYEGRDKIDLPSFWLKHPQRRTYSAVVFDPSATPGALENGDEERVYNLWRGFSVEPAAPGMGSWEKFGTHILENLCGGREDLFWYVFAWCAQIVQKPAERPGVALVLRGGEGTGKGTFATALGALCKKHFVHVSQPRQVTGNFNSHLASALILFADEAFWAGDKTGEGALKALVTEDQVQIERKGQDIVTMQSFLRLLVCSNSAWVVPAGKDARRFAVLDVGAKAQQDSAYFGAIREELYQQGGLEAWMRDLLAFDLARVDLRKIPQTEALLDQKISSLSSVERWWYGRLQEGELLPGDPWTSAHQTSRVYAHYLQECIDAGDRRRAVPAVFSAELKRLVPYSRVRRRLKTGVALVWDPEKRQRTTEDKETPAWCLAFPQLGEARRAFEQHLHSRIAWDTQDESTTQPELQSADPSPAQDSLSIF